jgi:hypothetical protein
VFFFCSNFPGKQTGERGKGLYIGVGVSGLCIFFFPWGGGGGMQKRILLVEEGGGGGEDSFVMLHPPSIRFVWAFLFGLLPMNFVFGCRFFFFLIFFTNAEIICGDDVRVDLTINS